MRFLNTQPSALEDPREMEVWMKFRVADPRVRAAALRDLVRNDTPLMVGASGYPTFGATLWSLDDALGRVLLNVEASASTLRETLEAPQVWAAAYVDAVKLQFPLHEPQIHQQGDRSVLSALTPTDLYRMPRRRSIRLRKSLKEAPRLVLHADGNGNGSGDGGGGEGGRSVVVLDISATGCALFFPPDAPVPFEGMILRKVEVRLDPENYIFTDIVVHNLQRASRGSHRVGCSWKGMPPGGEQTLRNWLRRGQTGLSRLSLQLD